MVHFSDQIPVYLQFRGMTSPIEVIVPTYVLRYLDTYAPREFAPDGMVIYRQPCSRTELPELHVPGWRSVATV